MLMATYTSPILEAIQIDSRYVLYKRILDIVVTLLLLPLILLVSLLVAVLIRLDSKGPVLFKQRRVGLNGAEFYVYKFRSMYMNSDEETHRQAVKLYMNGQALNNGASGNTHKLVNDPRVTRIGRLIRKTSLDELPQFINVLRGEMSLVGPRPPLPYELEYYSARDRLRLSGKPGLTGLWQVYGRSRVPFQQMVELDIQYLQLQSIWQDLKLIVLTVPVMVSGRGGA
jgi:lipopolysaccharide/colanic/teichoic acid biosynthesis glycosyltransferase